MVTFTVSLIVVNLMGLMYVWNISLNAISLVNLVMVCRGEKMIYCLGLPKRTATIFVCSSECDLERAAESVRCGGI